MSTMVDIYEPGDEVYTISNDGRVRVWVVQHDGLLARKFAP